MTNDEWELVRRWAEHASQPAFAELAGRYVRLVYGRCLRQLRDAHAAEDATQAVLLVLSEKAGALRPNVPLAAWLYRVAGYACRNEARVRGRRKRHETAAASLRMEATMTEATDSEVAALTPLLDAAVDRLGAADRQAVLLRYFPGRCVREVAAVLGVTETAAGRRLSRAVDKLRAAFAKQGVAVPAVGAAVSAIVAGTDGPTAAAAALPTTARATTRPLRWPTGVPAGMTTAAAAVAVAAVVGVAWRPVMTPPAPAPTPVVAAAMTAPATTAAAVGNVILVPFQVVIDRRLAAEVRRVGRPVRADAGAYAAVDVDAEQLLTLLREGQGRRIQSYGGSSQPVTHVNPRTMGDGRQPLLLSVTSIKSYGPVALQRMDIRQDAGAYKADLGDGRVTVVLDYGFQIDAQWRDQPAWTAAGRIKYAGEVAAGRAVAFVGSVGNDAATTAMLYAWMAVACPPADEPYLAVLEQKRWVDGGLDGALDTAATAAAWNAAAPPIGTDLADHWVVTEPTGEVVRLLAVSRPTERPFQWWDPDGGPVSTVAPNGRPIADGPVELPTGPLSVLVGVTLPGDHKRLSPWDMVAVADGPATNRPAAVEVVYGVGPWADGPTVRPGEKADPIWIDKIDGQPRTATGPGSVSVVIDEVMSADVQRRVAAVDRAGRVVPPSDSGDVSARLESARRPVWGEGRWGTSIPIAPADVDHYLVQTRPRHRARFAGVRTSPTVP